MKHIIKGREPASLLTYRKKPHATYRDYREKDDLRKSLIEEQGGLCCYCMGRITIENMKIEHRKPQRYKKLQLSYNNLLASCDGNEGKPYHLQHCDTHKADKEIFVNPTDKIKNCEKIIKYSANGRISSNDPAIAEDLAGALNLNTQTLVNNRKQTLKAVILKLTMIRGRKEAWSVNSVHKILKTYENRSHGKFKPYCRIVAYFLKKRFKNELMRHGEA